MIPLIIAADYPIYEQRIGGMDRFFWALDTELRRAGVSPVWVFPESTSSHHYREQGLDIRFVHRPSFAGDLTSLIAREGGVEVLVTHFVAYNTAYPARWKRAGAVRLISVDHMSRPGVPRSLAYRVRYLLKGIINWTHVDSVIAVSGYVRRSIMREMGWWWRSKTRVVWNGVIPPASMNLNLDIEPLHGEFSICYVGYLIPEKGVHVVLEAVSGIVGAGDPLRMTIAGDGPEAEPLAKLARQLGLEDNVDFIGPTVKQMEIMRMHDLVVVPSLWEEACGLVLLEAMMTGSCILASRIGGIPEMLGPGGGVTVEPGDVAAWRAGINALMHDPDLRSRHRNTAQRRAFEHFTLTRMVNDHIREIDAALTS